MSRCTTEPDRTREHYPVRPSSRRKSYRRPALEEYGTLVEVTGAIGSQILDSGGNLRNP